ncbi:MAG: DsbA family protein [Archaeoglobaceae archaeon]|nr:DsbA family protein [Archaeoglobaceae archaeon]MCX8152758.1 DsbA family protein [Archaeoglobaceae archaeon]MDW8013465.1 thioredoxin domain-containing protein [Archaeoglobaceae archaeon]
MKLQRFVLFAAVFLLGAVVSFAATKLYPHHLDVKTIEKTINDLLRENYAGLNAKISSYKIEGNAYLVLIDIYQNGTKVFTDAFYVIDNRLLIPAGYVFPIELKTEGQSIGSENPEVVIVEFSDYACPACSKFSLEVEKRILREFNVKIIFKNFPVHGETSYKAAQAALCAGEQGKYWEYHYVLFEKQSEWIRDFSKFYDYAANLNLDVAKFRSCYESGKYRSKVYEDFVEGLRYGVSGTPTFFIDGMKVAGYIEYEKFVEIMKRYIKK